MSSESHAPDRLGEQCPECGTHHRVIESIPDKPLSDEELESLRESEGVEFVRSLILMSGGLVGRDDAEEVTETIVLSTSARSLALQRYGGTGWVVEVEVEHESDDDPVEVGMDVWMEGSQYASAALSEVLDR